MSIREVQCKLNHIGLHNLKMDGVDGPMTQRFIKGVQHGLGVKEDGKWGPITEKAWKKWLQSDGSTKHFNKSEFKCRHCGGLGKIGVGTNRGLFWYLEIIRSYYRRPIKIVSGYRCSAHNKAVGGAKYSQHLYSKAADIIVERVDADKIYNFVKVFVLPYKGGVGKYPTFTHVDIRLDRSVW